MLKLIKHLLTEVRTIWLTLLHRGLSLRKTGPRHHALDPVVLFSRFLLLRGEPAGHHPAGSAWGAIINLMPQIRCEGECLLHFHGALRADLAYDLRLSVILHHRGGGTVGQMLGQGIILIPLSVGLVDITLLVVDDLPLQYAPEVHHGRADL